MWLKRGMEMMKINKDTVHAIGIATKTGRYAATYAHKDIAFEFASWISPEFLLNAVLFGKTAKQWRDDNPDEKGNIRDQATIYQLLVLANMESYNAVLLKKGKTQAERMQLLHELAVQQMTTLSSLELSNLPGIERK